ncbi:hypothetical protein LSH36_544g04019 [Paralvinella palmiformis]|uniref:SUEL-type lectin domain-containing protein n=1 Tax=Paralvinella palmiformis TaxID=53620 RepID=A0AAD9J7H5_9ANNE|nr:hypothetical protein LSH36_544g04019 [Paralvinella palmiformis]
MAWCRFGLALFLQSNTLWLIQSEIVCSRSHFIRSCLTGELLVIHSAQFGFLYDGTCNISFDELNPEGCRNDIGNRITRACAGKESCRYPPEENIPSKSMYEENTECVGTSTLNNMYMEVDYGCYPTIGTDNDCVMSGSEATVRVILAKNLQRSRCILKIAVKIGQIIEMTVYGVLPGKQRLQYGTVSEPELKDQQSLVDGIKYTSKSSQFWINISDFGTTDLLILQYEGEYRSLVRPSMSTRIFVNRKHVVNSNLRGIWRRPNPAGSDFSSRGIFAQSFAEKATKGTVRGTEYGSLFVRQHSEHFWKSGAGLVSPQQDEPQMDESGKYPNKTGPKKTSSHNLPFGIRLVGNPYNSTRPFWDNLVWTPNNSTRPFGIRLVGTPNNSTRPFGIRLLNDASSTDDGTEEPVYPPPPRQSYLALMMAGYAGQDSNDNDELEDSFLQLPPLPLCQPSPRRRSSPLPPLPEETQYSMATLSRKSGCENVRKSSCEDPRYYSVQ